MKIVEFKDYDNQTTPLSAYNLNRLQQNLITTKYQMTFSSAVSGGSTITLPCYYQVGQDTLDVYLNSELLKKASTKDSEGHYYEVGNSDTKSNQIKITSDWSIASGDVLNLIVRGTTDSYDQNLSPDKATQLADEISANKEEITALQTENSRLKGITNALPKISGEDTSLTLTNTANAPLSDIILKGNTSQQKYSGKNLLNVISNVNDTSNGITFSIEKNGFQLKLNGTSQNNTGIPLGFNKIQLPQTGTYYFVAQIISGSVSNSFGLAVNFGKDNSITVSNTTKSGKASLSATKTTGYLALFTQSNITFNNLVINMQVISTDTLDLDFEPWVGGTASPNPSYPQDIKVVTGDNTITISNSDNTEKQELPISLGSLELCKIGDYQDYIYKQDDKWYKHKMIKKTILNGTEKWTYLDQLKVFFTDDYEGEFASLSCFSNFFINKMFNGNNGAIAIGNTYHSSYKTLHLTNWNITTLSDWKNWLSNNKPIVYFTCYTPTEEEITDTTLISQLNELEKAVSYDDTTNISQTNANLPFIINAEAFKKIS